MKNRHITRILDRTEFNRISAADSTEIIEHIEICRQCRAAYQSARIASTLLKARSLVEPPAPTPFFQAKVLEARRSRQNIPKPLAAFRLWWQTSATLVLLMSLTVIGLMAVSLISSNTESSAAAENDADANLYSTETVILNQKPTLNLTTEQVFELLENEK